jgi:Ca2+-binding EF-hand superfamily protein
MGRGRNMPSFSDFDLNGDGVLLKEEFYDARAKRMYDRAEQGFALRNADKAPAFESVDTNGDGKVDAKEFEYHQQQHRKNTQ